MILTEFVVTFLEFWEMPLPVFDLEIRLILRAGKSARFALEFRSFCSSCGPRDPPLAPEALLWFVLDFWFVALTSAALASFVFDCPRFFILIMFVFLAGTFDKTRSLDLCTSAVPWAALPILTLDTLRGDLGLVGLLGYLFSSRFYKAYTFTRSILILLELAFFLLWEDSFISPLWSISLCFICC